MRQLIFITGTGTGIGKTIVSAIIAEALHADYWKPVQAGYEDGTHSEWVRKMFTNDQSKVHTETYKLKLAASPHIAAREEGTKIDLDLIKEKLEEIRNEKLEMEGRSSDAQQRLLLKEPVVY